MYAAAAIRGLVGGVAAVVMLRAIVLVATIAAGAVFLLAIWGQRGALAEPAQRPVGFKFASTREAETGDTLRFAIWYPTADAEKNTQIGPFTLRIAMEGRPADGTFPLVLFSHGALGSHLGHHGTLREIARAGFIVAAPLHTGDNFFDRSESATEAILSRRPAQVADVAMAVRSDTQLGPHVAAGGVGLVGYSAGGASVLALLGAVPRLATALAYCRSTKADPFCELLSESGMDKNGAAAAKSSDLGRARRQVAEVRAAVLLAPVAAWFTDDDLETIATPLLIWAGARDGILSMDANAGRIAQRVGGEVRLVREKKAGHFSFLTPLPDLLARQFPLLARDARGFDRTAFHKRMNVEIAEFLRAHLQRGGAE